MHGDHCHNPHGKMTCYTRRVFNSNNFKSSAALAEVCAVLSAILVVIAAVYF